MLLSPQLLFKVRSFHGDHPVVFLYTLFLFTLYGPFFTLPPSVRLSVSMFLLFVPFLSLFLFKWITIQL